MSVRGCAFGIALFAAACVGPTPSYHHSRYDYWAFKGYVGRLPEPNYLPWMMHLEQLPNHRAALVACRWPDAAFPLRYFVAEPSIPSTLQDEFHPRDPRVYVRAVEQAFARWQQAIGWPVRFRRVDRPEAADLQVHFRLEIRHEPPGQVVGRVPDEVDRCRVVGPGIDDGHVEIRYRETQLDVFLRDHVGLLTPRQVEGIALHEIGHVLGASGQHSPLRGDVMYKMVADQRVKPLSEHDRNSFRALYRIDPGAIYVRLGEHHVAPMPEVRRVPPRLGPPVRDERYGFEVRFPLGWEQIRSTRGWVAVDGVSWDYDASLQVIALHGSVEAYMAMMHHQSVPRGGDRRFEWLELDGSRVGRIMTLDSGRTEVQTLLEGAPGWILVVLADSASRDHDFYEPWFWSVLLSLERTPVTSPPEAPQAN